jgi:hypothetical protein
MKFRFISIFALFISLLTSTATNAQTDFSRIKITKSISMKVPTAFTPMSPAEIRNKYVSYRAPIAMFTLQDQQVDLSVNKNSTPWADNDYKILKDFYKANIQNLFTEVTFIQEQISTIGNREFVVFEFTSKVMDEENKMSLNNTPVSKYTYIMYTFHEGNVLLFHFNCKASQKALWQQVAKEIMESVRIN